MSVAVVHFQMKFGMGRRYCKLPGCLPEAFCRELKQSADIRVLLPRLLCLCVLLLNGCDRLEAWWCKCSFSSSICSKVCVPGSLQEMWGGQDLCKIPALCCAWALLQALSKRTGNAQLWELNRLGEPGRPRADNILLSVNNTVFKIININVSYFVSLFPCQHHPSVARGTRKENFCISMHCQW